MHTKYQGSARESYPQGSDYHQEVWVGKKGFIVVLKYSGPEVKAVISATIH